MELVLLVPVLVLLTLFVLWAGRGGRAGLTADLAAEEAATAAALCCDEGAAGEPDRDALAADMLRARPGLEFLCVGGLRPDAAPDRSGGPEFVSEHWLEFDPNPAVRTGGVGVLGVRFLCESDGAVAPLRGLFPTVTFHGQASEVVVRQPPPPYIGFESPVFRVDEDAVTLEFVVTSANPVLQDVYVEYALDSADLGLNYTLPPDLAPPLPPNTVLIPAGGNRVTIQVDLAEDDMLYEGTETLVLELEDLLDGGGNSLTAMVPPVVELDPGRNSARGEVTDDDARPYLFVSAAAVPCQVTEGGMANFNVRLRNQVNTADAPSATLVTVDVETSDGTATAGTDYTAVDTAATVPPGTLRFNAGDTTVPVAVQILDDAATPEGELTETFTLELKNEAGASVETRTVTCEILDDEVEVSVGPASADEGDGTLTFTVALDGVPTADVDIGYRLVDHARATHDAQRGGATDTCASPGYPVDYLPLDAIGPPTPPTDAALVISPSTLNQQADLAVTICDDTVAEPDETFWLEIEVQGGEAVVETDGGAVGTITDDDTLAISVDDVNAVEGTTLEFEVGLEVGGNPATLVAPVTLDYAIVASGTCSDSSHSTRTACEGAGETWTDPAAAGADYDAPGTCSVGSHSTRTACEGAGETWTVTTPLTGTLSFGAGLTTDLTLSVDLLADYLIEDDETFLLKLSDEDGSTHGLAITDAEAIGTITDDLPPYVSVRGFTGPEGSTRSFTVSLNEAPRSGDTVMVDYAIVAVDPCSVGSHSTRSACESAGGTWTDPATAGADYDAPGTCSDGTHGTRSACEDAGETWTVTTPLTGTVSFGSGETAKTVPVDLLADTVDEVDETFRIVLSNPVKAVLDSAASEAAATITNVDPTKLTVDDPTKKEGETLVFTVELEAPRDGQTVTVDYEVENRSAKYCRDYREPSTSACDRTKYGTTDYPLKGNLTLSDTTSTATVSVQALNDTIAENDETLHLVLSNVQSASSVGLEKSIGVGTIENVNPASVRVKDAAADEGDGLYFLVSLTDDAGDPAEITAPVTLLTWTWDGTATGSWPCSADGVDFASYPTREEIENGEAPGPYTLNYTPGGTYRYASYVGTCSDGDGTEGDENMQLTVELPTGTDNAVLADPVGIGTIVDGGPALRIEDAAASEGQQLSFDVRLVTRQSDGSFVETPAAADVTVTATTEDGTAEAGEGDYTAVEQELTIRAGATSVPLTVATGRDDIEEPPETMRVVLSGAGNVRIDRAVAIGTIEPRCVEVNTDDEDNRPPTIVTEDIDVEEGERFRQWISISRPLCDDPGLGLASYLESRLVTDAPASGVVALGTATCGSDFGTVGFGLTCREDSGSVYNHEGWMISLWDSDAQSHVDSYWRAYSTSHDVLDEDDEWFTHEVRWSADMPAHYQGLGWVSNRVTIIDNDDEAHLSVADAWVDEGGTMSFEVSLNAASGKTVTVEYRTLEEGGTAESADYTAATGTLTFIPGDTSKTFTVTTATDTDTEDETFLVELSAPKSSDLTNPAPAMNALIVDGVAIGTILEGGLSLRIGDASGSEGSNLPFTVTLSEQATQPVSVNYRTVERPAGPRAATAGSDYTATSGTLNFAVNEDSKTINVAIATDEEQETDETFLVELSDPVGASLADPSALGTIHGDVSCFDAWDDPYEDRATMTVDAPIVEEGDGVMTVTATLTEPFCEPENVVFRVLPDVANATLDVDYRLPRESHFSFSALDSTVSFDIPVINDDIAENNEAVAFRVYTFCNSCGTFRQNPQLVDGFGLIIDDDQASLSVDAASPVDEGDVVNFTARLDRPASFDVTFGYRTVDGTATFGQDYVHVEGWATIPAGELSESVSVATVQDSVGEDTETFGLAVDGLTAGVLLPDEEALTVVAIRDDDLPGVRISDAVANEGGTLTFTVTLDTLRAADTDVGYSTRDGTATAGDDYTLASSSSPVTIPAGELSATISVVAHTDNDLEANERFFVDLASHSSYRLDDGVGVGVIRDINDRTLTVSDAYTTEGGTLNFEVGFNGPSGGRDITVQYRTVAGTATAGDDYSASFESAAQTLRIVAGDTSAMASVPTVQDALDEDAEQLELVLSDPVGGVLATSRARGVILDDDPAPALSVSNAEGTENGDGTPITFTLSLSEPSGRDVSVRYSTADSTATAGSDYVAASNAAATIRAGNTTASVDVALVDDDDSEEVERFRLELSDPTNTSLGDAIGVGTILDDDGLVQILADDAAEIYEGDGAAAAFTVRLSRAADAAVTVQYSTSDATATAGDDYNAASSQSLNFAIGDTSKTVTVGLINDDTAESTETFRLVLSNPSSNAELGDDTAVATIVDDDGLPTLSVGDASAAEGATASFAVSLSKPSPRDVTVGYSAIADPTAGAAAAVPVQDFNTVSDTLTISARSTSATVAVPLPDDSLDEGTETFWLRLSDPSGATIVYGTATGAIDDNDPLPRLSIGNGAATEGETASFTVLLEPVSGRTVTVPWTTATTSTGNPAAPTQDFVSASGTLTFPSGTTSARIDVATLQDDTSEPDETFQVRLGQPTHATLADAIAVGAIHDDDGLPRVFIADTSVAEDDSPAIFTVTLSHTSSQAATVDYATSDGTATAGDDYATSTGAQGTLTIPAGLRRGEISVFVADDDEAEGSETFHITLSNPQNAAIAEGAGTATATIRDDDRSTITIAGAQASEGDGTIDFAVTLDHASTSDITVDYATFDGSATQPDDYTAAAGTLTIAANTTTATIAIALTDNTFIEEAESFLVRLSNPTGAEVATTEAIGIILDDDNLPIVATSTHLNVREDVGTVTIEITLSHASDLRATVNYTIGINSVTGPNCPQLVQLGDSGTIVFEPGDTAHSITLNITANDQECRWRGEARRLVSFYLELSDPDNAVLSASFGSFTQITVHDLQQLPFPFVYGASALEDAGTLPIRFEMSYAPSSDAEITYTVTAGTATAGVDYANVTGGTITVPAGQTEATLDMSIIDDDDIEGIETFDVRITDVTGGGRFETIYGGWLATGSIIDDDQVTVDVLDPAVEVAEGAGAVVVVLELDRTSSETVTVDYATSDGTATEPGDYTEVSGTATFASGETQKHVRVPLTDDDVAEQDETFTVVLTNAAGAVIGTDNRATVTINDDDGSALPTISLADSSESEGTSSFTETTLTLSAPSAQDVQVTWRPLAASWLGDRAADSSDWGVWGSPSAYTITIPANTTSAQLRLVIRDDSIPEHDERFIVALYDPVNAILGTQHAWHTIIDDDLPVLSVGDQTVSEDATTITFELELHAAGVVASSVDYATAVHTSAGDAAASPVEDYTHTSGTVTFAPGVSTATITVPILSDSNDELDETFLLILSDPSLLELGDSSAVGTITDDDPGWTIDDQSVWENNSAGENGEPVMVFNVVRDHTSNDPVTLSYQIAAAGSAVGGDDCDTDGVDYITPSGSVTLQAADMTATISITLCDDDDVEGKETLLIELTGVPGRKLTGVGTITSDDS
ncbi:MAG: hypothetical protein OXG66_10880 [Acidimicrobiaceae bacterium]|nr:hypothetical protein [Acidimicrobiaceae bacterium]MCY3644309.1 hypothetical protein [Acidimicrobiaceae bacterium]